MNTRPAGSVGLGAGAEKLLESAVCVGSTKRPAPATAPKLTASLFSLLGPIQGHFSACRLSVKIGGIFHPREALRRLVEGEASLLPTGSASV